MSKLKKAGFVGFEYNIELITSDHYTGEIKERTVVHNSIVNGGLERIAKLINGVSSTNFLAFLDNLFGNFIFILIYKSPRRFSLIGTPLS